MRLAFHRAVGRIPTFQTARCAFQRLMRPVLVQLSYKGGASSPQGTDQWLRRRTMVWGAGTMVRTTDDIING